MVLGTGNNYTLRWLRSLGAGGSQVPKEIVREEALHGAFVHINVNEVYDNLKLKMMRYFTTVPKLFNARYYLKVGRH